MPSDAALAPSSAVDRAAPRSAICAQRLVEPRTRRASSRQRAQSAARAARSRPPTPPWPRSVGTAPAARSSLAERSSTTAKCGAIPASSGKRLSSDWQKAWMVSICSPPGASSTGEERRARAIAASRRAARLGSSSAKRQRRARPPASPPSRPARSSRRFAISAAAALVKVRQRMRCGSHAGQQQAQHAVDQHLGLAGAGRGLDPDGGAAAERAPLPSAASATARSAGL